MLDMRMPGLSGMDVLAELREASKVLPVILFTSTLDVQQTVDAMKAGAFDYIPKPFSQPTLIDKVRVALEYNSKQMALHQQHLSIVSALSQLTSRERQVLDMIIEGRTSKNIATALGISSFTVDNHRARILDKMRATTTGQLVQMVCTTIALLSKS
jgi:two-component system response regulator FixJ